MLGVAFFWKPGGHVYLGVGSLQSWTRGTFYWRKSCLWLFFFQTKVQFFKVLFSMRIKSFRAGNVHCTTSRNRKPIWYHPKDSTDNHGQCTQVCPTVSKIHISCFTWPTLVNPQVVQQLIACQLWGIQLLARCPKHTELVRESNRSYHRRVCFFFSPLAHCPTLGSAKRALSEQQQQVIALVKTVVCSWNL